ncbi:M20/M25/M40 family metallo-hydrolase [Streptomyces sp.]|uniref:M20/M25/M40 family metallo-hydrolase n=1 Tax=Streptomyces sp. TaxID=1931 RepID=UPI002F421550
MTDTALDPVYATVRRHVRAHAARLWDVSLALHRRPEIAFQEHRAAELLAGELEAAGLGVERGVAGMPTAFVARAEVGGRGGGGGGDAGGGGPRVALLLEYDALPGLGHACGHNLIAAAGLGAGLAVRAALAEGGGPGEGVPAGDAPVAPVQGGGTLMVVGTPAEERGGGKAIAAEAGLFDGVDAALMFHPGVHDWAWAPLTASALVRVGFHGRAAHPTGNPTEGIDALAALIELFNTLSGLARRLPSGSHVQGVITDGGKAANIVPDYAEGLFGLRGATTAALEDLVAQLGSCADGIAHATGATAETTRIGPRYQHFRDSPELSGRFTRHLARTGIQLTEPAPGTHLGSSDMGNVSTRVPAIHPFVAIMGPDGSHHTPEFAAAAAGPRAREVMLAAAEALACTAADVLLTPAVRDTAWTRLREKAAAGQ